MNYMEINWNYVFVRSAEEIIWGNKETVLFQFPNLFTYLTTGMKNQEEITSVPSSRSFTRGFFPAFISFISICAAFAANPTIFRIPFRCRVVGFSVSFHLPFPQFEKNWNYEKTDFNK